MLKSILWFMNNFMLLFNEISVGDLSVFFDILEKIVIVINNMVLFIEEDVSYVFIIFLLFVFWMVLMLKVFIYDNYKYM